MIGLHMTVRPMPAVLLLGLLSAGCASSRPAGSAGGTQEARTFGSFKVASAHLENSAPAVTSCQAGDRLSFVGVDLFDDAAGTVVRLVVDPLYGPAVRVFALDDPYDKSVVFRRDDCRTFKFEMKTSGWRINGATEYHLKLELDCARPTGDSIVGQVAIRNCS